MEATESLHGEARSVCLDPTTRARLDTGPRARDQHPGERVRL